MNKEKYVQMLRILYKNYNKEFDKEQVTIWFGFLKQYDVTEIENALNEICIKNKFFPSLADIIEKIENKKNISTDDIFEKIRLCIQKYPYNINQCADRTQIDGMYEILGDVGFKIINQIGYENLSTMNDYNRKTYKEEIDMILKKENEQLKLIANKKELTYDTRQN